MDILLGSVAQQISRQTQRNLFEDWYIEPNASLDRLIADTGATDRSRWVKVQRKASWMDHAIAVIATMIGGNSRPLEA